MIPGQAPANVRFAPRSGHKWLWCGMSAFDPKRTFWHRPFNPKFGQRTWMMSVEGVDQVLVFLYQNLLLFSYGWIWNLRNLDLVWKRGLWNVE